MCLIDYFWRIPKLMSPEKLEQLKLFFAKKTPGWVHGTLVKIYGVYKNILMHQEKKSFGDKNPDKTFFVIRLFPPAVGYLANYNYVLGYMRYAYEHGWIPVVDMENYATFYQEEEPVNGTRNVWEYYFLQPEELGTGKRYSLAEVYQSKNVILANGSMQLQSFNACRDKEILKWQSEMARRAPFNETTLKHLEEVRKQTVPEGVPVIGVAFRGSDMGSRMIGHYIQATVDDVVPRLRDKLNVWGQNNTAPAIFVKSEEAETVTDFAKHFDNVCYVDEKRLENFDKDGIHNAAENYKNSSKYQQTLDYFTSIYILSKCDYLMGSMNNGVNTAIIWNGGEYIECDVIDKGIYK